MNNKYLSSEYSLILEISLSFRAPSFSVFYLELHFLLALQVVLLWNCESLDKLADLIAGRGIWLSADFTIPSVSRLWSIWNSLTTLGNIQQAHYSGHHCQSNAISAYSQPPHLHLGGVKQWFKGDLLSSPMPGPGIEPTTMRVRVQWQTHRTNDTHKVVLITKMWHNIILIPVHFLKSLIY